MHKSAPLDLTCIAKDFVTVLAIENEPLERTEVDMNIKLVDECIRLSMILKAWNYG